MNEQKIKKEVGDIIRKLRKGLNLTQANLAKIIGINQRQVVLIETGKSFPSLATMVKLTNVFQCEIKDFFNFDDKKEHEALQSQMKNVLDDCSITELKQLYDFARFCKDKKD